MIGDSPRADIGGGKQAGLQTIWMARGRTWDSSEFGPDAIVHIIPEAVESSSNQISDRPCHPTPDQLRLLAVADRGLCERP